MQYVITPHAAQRMAERGITHAAIGEALRHPTAVSQDEDGRVLVKKLYRAKEKSRLLLVVVEQVNEMWTVITVIDTSKTKKYL